MPACYRQASPAKNPIYVGTDPRVRPKQTATLNSLGSTLGSTPTKNILHSPSEMGSPDLSGLGDALLYHLAN